MPYLATGRVHPERADVSFGSVNWRTSNNGSVTASCESSQLFVSLDLPDLDGYVSAYIAAEHFAQIVVNSLGFSLGTGYSVEIIQVVEENATPHVFGVRPGNLEFKPHIPVFNQALQLASEDLFFRLALRDYARAMTDSTDCATYCYRAIEAIRSAFSFRSGTDGWEEMHTALATDRATISRVVKDYADPVRHGNWIAARPTDAVSRNEMLLLTRDILHRYMTHVRPPA